MCAVRNEAKAAPPFTYFTDLKNPLLLEQFEKRGWQTIPRWDLFWTNILSPKISASYRRIGAFRIGRNQKINHFPRSEQLCRKDLLVKNLHSYVERSHCRLRDIDFLPATYRLPSEYAAFEADYRANAASIWIMKPLDKCQGKGIYLVHQLPEVRRRLQEAQYESSDYLISRYIERPLLIGGRKFDLRLFVLVTSFRPLRAYLYNDGFCRVCSERYTNHFDTLQNRYVHLTNVRVQQSSPKYNGLHGGKWSLRWLQLYLDGTRGDAVRRELFGRISTIIRHSLKAVQPVIHSGRNFFECFGYDILVDDEMKPWLVEVNSNPSLNGTTPSDCALKAQLIQHILNVIFGGQTTDANNFRSLFRERLTDDTDTV